MTKGELVDQVYIKVHAGRPNGDVPIHRALIANLLPAAINFIVVGEYRIRRDERRADLSPTDLFGAVDPEFLGTFKVGVQKDQQHSRYFAELPHKVQSIPHGLGLDEIRPCNGMLVHFHKLNSPVELLALDESIRNSFTAFWLEQTSNVQKIYFNALSPMVKEVEVRMVVSAKNLKNTDELPLPEGTEFQVIDLLFNHFMGLRQIPSDVVADGNENPKL